MFGSAMTWPTRFSVREPIDNCVDQRPLFKVIGVNTRQGTFLGLFSWDSDGRTRSARLTIFLTKSESDVRVKIKTKPTSPKPRMSLPV
jgi:hypothetical protein